MSDLTKAEAIATKFNKVFLALGVIGVLCVVVFGKKTAKSDSIPIAPTPTIENTSSTIANCVVCGKQSDYYQENIYMGHHVKVGGLMSSDVVCGIDCDLTLRKRNERIINDPNSYRDPDIKMPDIH